MFSTILKEATGYFDRRALISAFFPSLIFWGFAVIVVLSQENDWRLAFKAWESLSITAQAIFLIVYFVWVAFWAFMIINFRTALIRLYEGYWPTKVYLVASFEHWRSKRWQKSFDELDSFDSKLHDQEVALKGEICEYKNLRDSLDSANAKKENTEYECVKQIINKLDKYLSDAEIRLNKLENAIDPKDFRIPVSVMDDQIATLIELGRDDRDFWLHLTPYLAEVASNNNHPLSQSYYRLEEITRKLDKRVNRHLEKVEAQRLRINHDLFLYYPPHRNDVMPTQLGNVLKAAEMYSWERYRVDALLIWSRLQPALPKEFLESFQNSEMSLDLMVTLSVLTLLFGLPLSVGLAFRSSGAFTWLLPALLMVIALLLRFYMASLLAIASSVLIFAIPFMPSSFASTAIKFQIFLEFTAMVLLLAWLEYQSAVQAGLTYGEKIKASFDLYRWKVLEELHLELPKDFEEERCIWNEVCSMLYRGYAPEPKYYRYVQEESQ